MSLALDGRREPALGEKGQRLREEARRWAQTELAPKAREREAEGSLPDEVYEQAGERGIMGLTVSEADGGTGASTLTAGAVLGEVAKGDSAAGLSIGAHNVLAVNHVAQRAEGKLRERWLPRLASGQALGAWALTEPGGGSDVLSMGTQVRTEGEELVLEGEKCFITNGSRADAVVVVAADAEGGYSAVLVPDDTPGFHASSEHDLVCMEASDTAALRFDEARVPRENLLGERGTGLADAFACLNLERVVMAAISTATARHALRRALEHAQQKGFEAAPDGKEPVARSLARLRVRVEAASQLWRRAARARDGGELESWQAAQAKLHATETAQHAAQEAVRLHGWEGLEEELELERGVRDGLLGPLGGGTSEMQEIVVARGMGIDADPYRA